MAASIGIGNDILDIGSRKARRGRGDPFAINPMTLGNPGQFDLPAVADVSVLFSFMMVLCHNLSFIS